MGVRELVLCSRGTQTSRRARLGGNSGEDVVWLGFFVLSSPDFVEPYVQTPSQHTSPPDPKEGMRYNDYYADNEEENKALNPWRRLTVGTHGACSYVLAYTGRQSLEAAV